MALLTLCFFILYASCYSLAKPTSQTFTSIFAFGNSYTDTGNYPFVAAKAGLSNISDEIPPSPFGITFFGHPAGRYSDGRLTIDFIAEEFGIPFVRPFQARNGNFTEGTNFAVVGAYALPVDFYTKNGYMKNPLLRTSLEDQLAWFKEFKTTLCNTTADWQYFSRSLFYFGEFGVNDYNLLLLAGKSVQDLRNSYVPRLVKLIVTGVEKLITEGARTLVVANQPPAGCAPAILAPFASSNKEDYEPDTGCLKEYNALASYHNLLLREELTRLKRMYPRVKISYADYYYPIISIMKTPRPFGFINTPLRVCCGKGDPYNYNTTQVCGMPGVRACQNPSTYLHWDGVHLTEAAYRYISTTWIDGPYADPPLKDLINEQV